MAFRHWIYLFDFSVARREFSSGFDWKQIAVGLLLTRTVDGSKFHNRRQGALLFVGP
jgi:hypothetical protein